MHWEGNTSHLNRTVQIEMWGSVLNSTARRAFLKGGAPLVCSASLVLLMEQDKGSVFLKCAFLGRDPGKQSKNTQSRQLRQPGGPQEGGEQLGGGGECNVFAHIIRELS